jgi:hypothetical protein
VAAVIKFSLEVCEAIREKGDVNGHNRNIVCFVILSKIRRAIKLFVVIIGEYHS